MQDPKPRTIWAKVGVFALGACLIAALWLHEWRMVPTGLILLFLGFAIAHQPEDTTDER